MPTTPDTAPPRGPALRIVAFNDVYSLENLPRFATLVRHHREVAPADVTLVTVAGDFLAPSMLSSLDGGRGMVDCLGAVGVTHVTFGNHEDDVPLAELRRRIGELSATWIATNVRDLDDRLAASAVIDVAARGGRAVKVGLVGVVMADASVYRAPPFGGATVAPANASAAAAARALVADAGCACVVPLTHQPIGDDRALALAVREPPFPVIVGGHEHEVYVERVDGTTIVKAGTEAAHAAVIDLVFAPAAPADGAIDAPAVTVRIEEVGAHAEDPGVRARVDAHMARVRALERAVLLAVPPGAPLSSVGTRRHQTSLGTLVCTLLRRALGAEACFFNGGGIRAGREYRQHLTFGDVKAEIPFDNKVVVARLPGRVIDDAVRFSRGRAPAEFGGFLQVDDATVVDAEGRVRALAGAPLEPEREYRVALVRNVFEGLDGIAPLVAFAKEHPDRVPPEDSGRETKEVLVTALAIALWNRLGGVDAVDLDHDGFVTESEIALAVERATGAPPSSVTVDVVLRAIDANQDRRLDRDEVAAATYAPAAPTPRGE